MQRKIHTDLAKEADSQLGLLTVSSYIHRHPIETEVTDGGTVGTLSIQFVSALLGRVRPAPSFLDRKLLRGLLPPFQKTSLEYLHQLPDLPAELEEDAHNENVEPPAKEIQRLLCCRKWLKNMA